jgi:hypothetical protein
VWTCASTGPKYRSAARARGRPGCKAFVSGKKKQNTIKTTTFSDGQGRTLFSGVVRPGRMHDQTQSSARICVEHTNAEYKQWRPLQRFTGRRETYTETHLAIAGLVSDRSAQRATHRKTITELVLARQSTC